MTSVFKVKTASGLARLFDRSSLHHSTRYPFRVMKPGDWFLVQCPKAKRFDIQHTLCQSIINAKKRNLRGRFTTQRHGQGVMCLRVR